MRACAKSVLLLLLIRLVSTPGAAQNADLRYNSGTLHALTAEEGLAVLGAALDFRHYRGVESDCSHFVHLLYQRAGFPYAYAPSVELYSGIDQFQRVTTPQAGDLAVWRGHAGIVVNPVQHSFFSLLRSGAGVESYDSPYWRRRGHPRFFRYVKSNPGTGLATSLRNTSLNATAGEDADSQPVRDDPSRSEQFSNPGRSSTSPADAKRASPVIPQNVVLNSHHPTPDQVRTAFLRSCADSEESLAGRDLLKSDRSLVIFGHFIVRKLHISGTQGWAEVDIDEMVSVTGGRSEVHNHSERQRWPLIRRAQASWELSLPQGTIYLPQDIAAHITAQQLAQLTRDSPSDSNKTQKVELAQLLNVLLQK